ncbi:hypothetical protein CRE_13311 [Caenorhabditis remanei]|uniref:Uncharacterized protein n=1 Tax=Caenorhabditis remanei TaxID=31234 RepID=E3M850_CAERE|nr:hypothetical protein CRE_13311 [Caenorhabditis remanei]
MIYIFRLRASDIFLEQLRELGHVKIGQNGEIEQFILGDLNIGKPTIASNPAATTTTVNAEEARPDTPYPESTTPRAGTPEPKALLAVIRQKELWGDEGRPPGNGTVDRTGQKQNQRCAHLLLLLHL